MEKQVTPLFIISMARSGSTLLQRILSSHSKISSIAEPFILLPLLYTYKKTKGTITDYGHHIARNGMRDMIKNLPMKEDEFDNHISNFVNNVYSSLSGKKDVYFLDKTPRYIFIIPEIAKIFPHAKFIFLFRNPVQIYASILSSFGKGRLKHLGVANFFNELKEGPKMITEGYSQIIERSIALRYEEFVQNPEQNLQVIMEYLNLEYESDMLSQFYKKDLKGVNIDPTGTKMYKKVNIKPLKKWEKIFGSRYRKSVIKNYVKKLDEDVLNIMGYDKIDILKEIDNIKVNGNYNLFLDIVDYNRSKIISRYARLYFS